MINDVDPPYATTLDSWFSAMDIAQADGSPVSVWTPRIGVGRDLVAATTPPVLDLTAHRGYPAVRWDGVTAGHLEGLSLGRGSTVVVIGRMETGQTWWGHKQTYTNGSTEIVYHWTLGNVDGDVRSRYLTGGNVTKIDPYGYPAAGWQEFAIGSRGADTNGTANLGFTQGHAGTFKAISLTNTYTGSADTHLQVGGGATPDLFKGYITDVLVFAAEYSSVTPYLDLQAWATHRYPPTDALVGSQVAGGTGQLVTVGVGSGAQALLGLAGGAIDLGGGAQAARPTVGQQWPRGNW